MKRPKHTRIGPHITFDAERCILCRRCVRFCRDIVGSAELGIFHRGDESQIGLFPGKVLDNPYSGNVIDLCPVGALTSTDYRFQSRPWDLVGKVDSTCALCSRGCSITFDVRHRQRPGAEILRVRPRHNAAVNGYWMCDEGRFGFRRYTAGPRLVRPVLRWGGGPVEAEWEETLRGLATSLRALLDRPGPPAVGVIASAFLTNEELYLVRRFAADVLHTPHLDHRLRPSQAPGGDQPEDALLRRTDPAPNTTGARLLGLVPGPGGWDTAGMLRAAADGTLRALLLLGEDLEREVPPGLVEPASLGRLDLLVARNLFAHPLADRAHVFLPATQYVEKTGTFTNVQGRVQRVAPAREAPKTAPPLGEVLVELARRLGAPLSLPTAPSALWEALAADVPAFAGITWDGIGPDGVPAQT